MNTITNLLSRLCNLFNRWKESQKKWSELVKKDPQAMYWTDSTEKAYVTRKGIVKSYKYTMDTETFMSDFITDCTRLEEE